VAVAVEAIMAHFLSSKTLVEEPLRLRLAAQVFEADSSQYAASPLPLLSPP
jgi:hypothetical protein